MSVVSRVAESAPAAAATNVSSAEMSPRLMPLMVGMVVGLTLFFFIASLIQLTYLQRRIEQAPTVDLAAILLDDAVPWQRELTPNMKVLAILEANAFERRYHQANVLLMSRVWARYLGFVTGMILALVGAGFILGRLRELSSEISASGPGSGFSLRSSSPGLVLATLGVVLMAMTIVTHQEITTSDTPIYLRPADPRPAIAPAAENAAVADAADATGTDPYNW